MRNNIIVVIHDKSRSASLRHDGTYSCLIGSDKQKLIAQAFKMKAKWESDSLYGPYDISIGILKESAVTPNFKLIKY